MKPYSRWKYILLVVIVALGALYALPNVYGDEPAVQISTRSGDPLPADFTDRVAKALTAAQLAPTGSGTEQGRQIVRFADESAQLRAADVRIHSPVITFMGGGMTAAYCRDPHGNVFEIMEPGKPSQQ